MEAIDYFYITATIAFVLFSVLVVAAIIFLIKAAQWLKSSLNRVNSATDDLSQSFHNMAKGFGRITVSSILLRILRMFILRR